MTEQSDAKAQAKTTSQSAWAEIAQAIEQLAAECSDLDQDTINNARLLVDFASGRYEVANEIGRGYWPTISLNWTPPSAPIEVEIFSDHYEFYRFSDGSTEIQHIAAIQNCIPDHLGTLLDTFIAVNPIAEFDT